MTVVLAIIVLFALIIMGMAIPTAFTSLDKGTQPFVVCDG